MLIHKITIVLLGLLFLSETKAQSNCNCGTFPLISSCIEYCLGNGSASELQKGLRLDEQTAKAIENVPNRKNFNSLEEFKAVLSYNVYTKLENHINNYYSSTSVNNYHSGSGDIVNGDKRVTYVIGDTAHLSCFKPTDNINFYFVTAQNEAAQLNPFFLMYKDVQESKSLAKLLDDFLNYVNIENKKDYIRNAKIIRLSDEEIISQDNDLGTITKDCNKSILIVPANILKDLGGEHIGFVKLKSMIR